MSLLSLLSLVSLVVLNDNGCTPMPGDTLRMLLGGDVFRDVGLIGEECGVPRGDGVGELGGRKAALRKPSASVMTEGGKGRGEEELLPPRYCDSPNVGDDCTSRPTAVVKDESRSSCSGYNSSIGKV